MEKQTSTFLRTIPFSEFYLWDVKRYNSTLQKGEGWITLRDILVPYTQALPKEEIINNKWRIVSKINFGGELFLRDFADVHSYKGNVLKVPDNSILYSKINVRHGCVYYHPNNAEPFGVSSEYPVFQFNPDEVNGEYLHKALRSKTIRDYLNTKTTGISKARVKVDEFLSIPLPLPSLDEQNRIVEAYNKKIQLAQKQEDKVSKLKQDLPVYINNVLGIKETSLIKSNKESGFLKFVMYSSVHKWGVDKQSISNVLYKKNFQIKPVSQICTVSSGGTPSRNRNEYYTGKIPWIKTSEVRNELILNTEEKITPEAIKSSSAKLYPKGSIIIAMYGQGATRGRTAKLGIDATTNQACAVLSKIDDSKIDTDFLWVYFMNEYNRLRALASGNNQPNLNAQMIKDYKVVIPPLEIQAEIIEVVSKMKEEIDVLMTKAEKNRAEAIKEFENEIFNN